MNTFNRLLRTEFVMVSAYMKGMSAHYNLRATHSMKTDLKKQGFQFIAGCIGGYQGNVEQSFLVRVFDTERDLCALMTLAERYNQESLLHCYDGKARLIGCEDGDTWTQSLGDIVQIGATCNYDSFTSIPRNHGRYGFLNFTTKKRGVRLCFSR